MNDTSEPRVIAGDFVVATVGGKLRAIAGGGVRVGANGRIEAVGPVNDIAAGAPVETLGGCVLTPGLINAHTHMDLSGWAGRRDSLAGRPLHEWVVPVAGGRFMQSPEQIAEAAADGARASLAAGVTTVVDITPGSIAFAEVLDAILEVPIRRIALAEVIGFETRGAQTLADAREALAAAEDRIGERLIGLGLSPHAPYSTGRDAYVHCLLEATRAPLVLATHLAETDEEAEFTRSAGGPWRELLEKLAGPQPELRPLGNTPVQFAVRVGLLDHPRTLLAHVNYPEPGDIDRLAACPATVVYCPRTHAFFGHAPHAWREMLAAGVNVAVGTDSLASSPDLSILGELHFLRQRHDDVSAVELFELATTRPAAAIGRDDLGRLARGAWADLVAWPVAGGDDAESLLAGVIDANAVPAAVFVGGSRVNTP